MRRASFVFIFCTIWVVTASHVYAGAKSTSPVEVLGNFASLRHGNGHAYGYTLRLWKNGDQYFGLLAVYTGQPADPPVGILEDVKFDPRTKQLSFSARLSTGLVYSQAYSGVPSRDRFTFKGALTGNKVIGTLTKSNELFPDAPPTSERVRLRRSEFLTQLMTPPPATHSAWKTWANKILERRGPKW